MPADGERPLAIVVVSFASAALLERHLVSTQASVRPDLVVVVDNRSTEAERRAVDALARAHGWVLVSPSSNLGFGGGANAGVAAARARGARDLLVLNPDAHIDARSVAALRRAADDDGLSMLAPVMQDAAGRSWFAGADVYLDDGSTRAWSQRERFASARRWEWLSGACLWIPEEAWCLTGGFDEEYFLYWEDVDLSRRLVERGGRLKLVDDAVAVHDEGGTHRDAKQGARAKSSVYYYYNIRNRMLFAVKHLDSPGVARWQRQLLPSAREVLLRGGRRQFLQSLRPLRAAYRGVADARRIVRSASHAPHRRAVQ